MQYDYAYWLQPAPKRESFASWEKRHRPCLRTDADGKPFYDWFAAKKVGKRNGKVPAGMYNGIIGYLHRDKRYTPKLLALYAQYVKDYRAMGLVLHIGKETRCAQPHGYMAFVAGDLAHDAKKTWRDKELVNGHKEWLDAHWDEYQAAKSELEEADEIAHDVRQRYDGYCAFAVRHRLKPKPWAQWLESLNGHAEVPQGHADSCVPALVGTGG